VWVKRRTKGGGNFLEERNGIDMTRNIFEINFIGRERERERDK
jgi:hypothetical protein